MQDIPYSDNGCMVEVLALGPQTKNISGYELPVLPRITPQGGYFFVVVKKGGVIRGMGGYYFESVVLPKSLPFLFTLLYDANGFWHLATTYYSS